MSIFSGQIARGNKSERKLHGELKDPRVLSTGNIAESARAAQCDRGVIEAHVIEHVKRLYAELEVFTFADTELSHHRHIELEEFRAQDVERAHIAECARGRLGKSSGIQP